MIDFTKNLHPLSNLRDREEPEIFLSQGMAPHAGLSLPGAEIQVAVLRKGKEMKFPLKVAELSHKSRVQASPQ